MLDLLCTQLEYDAASPEAQRDFDWRLIESWQQTDDRAKEREFTLDRERAEGQW